MTPGEMTPEMTRADALASLSEPFDVLVIGGGATGLGIAVDAVTRGFRTALVEAGDFAQSTSSRATKLVHGGVRYLASGQIPLVYEALRERAVLLRNAPHLVRPQAFLLPTYTRRELPWYGAGLLVYDAMSGRATMGPTRILGRRATLDRIPNLSPAALTGSVLYHDGQFNDARLALALARTAADRRATVLNYVRCTRLLQTGGKLSGAILTDTETGQEHTVSARTIFNATGIFTDQLRHLDNPATSPLLTFSRGTHIVVEESILGGSAGIMVPKTRDGRVIFAIPWQGRVVIGTTDLPAPQAAMEPGHTPAELDFLLETINPFLARKIGHEDILSVFSGLRPLVTGKAAATSKISREHQIDLSPTGLVTVAGGKWTTYRRMAEDALDFAATKHLLPRHPCQTLTLPLHGRPTSTSHPADPTPDPHLREYGSDIPLLDELIAQDPTLAQPLDPALPYTFAQILFAARHEMARTLEDVLSRRTRALLLDRRATLRAAPRAAAILALELGRDASWIAQQLENFAILAQTNYSTQEIQAKTPANPHVNPLDDSSRSIQTT